MSSRQKMNQGECPERWKNKFFPYSLRKICLDLGMVTIATLTVIFLGCSVQQKVAQAQLTPATSEWKAGVLIISIFFLVSVSLWIYLQQSLAQQTQKEQPIEIREYEGEKLSKYRSLTNTPFLLI